MMWVWQPNELPENETEETLLDKQAQLQKIIDELGPRNSLALQCQKIDDFMNLTYILQRRLINSEPPLPLQDIKTAWPFLFIERWLFIHFERLVGKAPILSMRQAMETKASRICNYFKHVQANGSEQIDGEGSNVQTENATVAAVMI